MQKDLPGSHQHTALILESVGEGIQWLNARGMIMLENSAALKMLGWEESEMIGRHAHTLLHHHYADGEEYPVDACPIHQTLRDGQIRRVDNEVFFRKGGNSFPVEYVCSPVLDESGAITGTVVCFRDVTDRKHMQEQLIQSEERLRGMFDSTRDVICTLSPTATITSLNPSFERLTGWKRDEWLGKSFAEILHPDDLVHTHQMFQMAMQGTVPEVFEIRARTQDGSYVAGEVNASPLRKEGKIEGVLATIRDVSRSKKLEEQLVQAQKFQSLGTLASGVAHDFNNILGIIMGHATLLETQKSDPEKIPQRIEAIRKASHRGATLVKQLLTFARKTEVLFESVDINDVIKEISAFMRETFPKNIDIATNLAEGLPPITADAGQIHQVILNLCVNARDALPSGGSLSIITKTIPGFLLQKRYVRATARDYAEIRVIDNGAGMDEQTVKRIFEPFFTTKGVGKGTGLGLSVVRGIVETHKGFIDVRSTIGKGSSFRVYLPIQEWNVRTMERSKGTMESIPGGKETILIIEDEEMLRELVKTILLSQGYSVLTAENGLEGVESYAHRLQEISLVLTDLGLPALGGEAVFKRIKEINPKAKVVVASGFIDPNVKSELFKAGVRSFIQKPYQPEEVLRVVREVIDE